MMIWTYLLFGRGELSVACALRPAQRGPAEGVLLAAVGTGVEQPLSKRSRCTARHRTGHDQGGVAGAVPAFQVRAELQQRFHGGLLALAGGAHESGEAVPLLGVDARPLRRELLQLRDVAIPRGEAELRVEGLLLLRAQRLQHRRRAVKIESGVLKDAFHCFAFMDRLQAEALRFLIE